MSESAAGGDGARSGQRIVVFTGDMSYTVRKGIVEIDDAIPGLKWLVLICSPRLSLRRVLRSQIQNLKRNGWRWIPYQVRDLWRRRASRGVPREPCDPVPGCEYTTKALRERPNIRIETVDDLHEVAAIECVRRFEPDLGLSLAAPILRRTLFAVPRLGSINLHKGKLPEFRGMPPAFWELWHDASSVGCSVHCIDDKLDTGHLLGESQVSRARHSTVKGLQLEVDEVAIGLTTSAVRAMLDGTAVPRPQQKADGVTFRKPTLVQEAHLRARLAGPVGVPQRLKSAVKDGLAAAVIGSHRLGLSRLLAPRVTVLLYHRVTDDVRDNLTVGVEQFARQMEWLAARCRVLSIEEVVAMDTVPRSDEPLLAVTFDDGYFDNYWHAAPILRRYGIPAAFFVSTGIVNSDKSFPHDIGRGNPPIPKMSWDQLREMRRWGFTVGSHMVNHIDCAGEPEDVVRRELAQSLRDLREQLGVGYSIFAYPYGGRRHMTAERLEAVKEAGYVACLSAYGGSNIGRVDRFNVLRSSISNEFSDPCFQRLCLGLRR